MDIQKKNGWKGNKSSKHLPAGFRLPEVRRVPLKDPKLHLEPGAAGVLGTLNSQQDPWHYWQVGRMGTGRPNLDLSPEPCGLEGDQASQGC